MDESTVTDEGKKSILKPRHRLPLHEVQSFFPDDDVTVTTTLTKSRRVSFGRNLVKGFIVGSAASTQAVYEYEQSSESISDPSECSGPLDLAVNKTVPVETPAAPAQNRTSNAPLDCSLSGAAGPSSDRARAFVENCISIAKGVFQDSEGDLTAVIISSKSSALETSYSNFDTSNRFDDGKGQFDFMKVGQSEMISSCQQKPQSIDKGRFDFLDRSISQTAQQIGPMKVTRPSVRTPLGPLPVRAPWEDENDENIPPAHSASYHQPVTPTATRVMVADNTMEFTCANPKLAMPLDVSTRSTGSGMDQTCGQSSLRDLDSDMEETCGRPLRKVNMDSTSMWDASANDDGEDPLRFDGTRDGFLSDLSGLEASDTDGSFLEIQKDLANLSAVNENFRQQIQSLNASATSRQVHPQKMSENDDGDMEMTEANFGGALSDADPFGDVTSHGNNSFGDMDESKIPDKTSEEGMEFTECNRSLLREQPLESQSILDNSKVEDPLKLPLSQEENMDFLASQEKEISEGCGVDDMEFTTSNLPISQASEVAEDVLGTSKVEDPLQLPLSQEEDLDFLVSQEKESGGEDEMEFTTTNKLPPSLGDVHESNHQLQQGTEAQSEFDTSKVQRCQASHQPQQDVLETSKVEDPLKLPLSQEPALDFLASQEKEIAGEDEMEFTTTTNLPPTMVDEASHQPQQGAEERSMLDTSEEEHLKLPLSQEKGLNFFASQEKEIAGEDEMEFTTTTNLPPTLGDEASHQPQQGTEERSMLDTPEAEEEPLKLAFSQEKGLDFLTSQEKENSGDGMEFTTTNAEMPVPQEDDFLATQEKDFEEDMEFTHCARLAKGINKGESEEEMLFDEADNDDSLCAAVEPLDETTSNVVNPNKKMNETRETDVLQNISKEFGVSNETRDVSQERKNIEPFANPVEIAASGLIGETAIDAPDHENVLHSSQVEENSEPCPESDGSDDQERGIAIPHLIAEQNKPAQPLECSEELIKPANPILPQEDMDQTVAAVEENFDHLSLQDCDMEMTMAAPKETHPQFDTSIPLESVSNALPGSEIREGNSSHATISGVSKITSSPSCEKSEEVGDFAPDERKENEVPDVAAVPNMTVENATATTLPINTPLAGLAALAARPSLREKLSIAQPESTVSSMCMDGTNMEEAMRSMETSQNNLVKTMSDEQNMRAIFESTRIIQSTHSNGPNAAITPIPSVETVIEEEISNKFEETYAVKKSADPEQTYTFPKISKETEIGPEETYVVEKMHRISKAAELDEQTYTFKKMDRVTEQQADYVSQSPVCDSSFKRVHSDSPMLGERMKKSRSSASPKTLNLTRNILVDEPTYNTTTEPTNVQESPKSAPLNVSKRLHSDSPLPVQRLSKRNRMSSSPLAKNSSFEAEVSFSGPAPCPEGLETSMVLLDISASSAGSLEHRRDDESLSGIVAPALTPRRAPSPAAEKSLFADKNTSDVEEETNYSITVPQPALFDESCGFSDHPSISSPAVYRSTPADESIEECVEPTREPSSMPPLGPATCERVERELRSQGGEENCLWDLNEYRDCSDGEGAVSVKIRLLNVALIISAKFKHSGNTCRTAEWETTEAPSERFEWPENRLVNQFGIRAMRSYVEKEFKKLEKLDQLPYFLDFFNAHARKLTALMKDAAAVLRGCPSAELMDNKLAIRLYSFPTMSRCVVLLDLMDMLQIGRPSFSIRHETGRMNEASLRNLISSAKQPVLQNWTRSAYDLISAEEMRGGFVTKRPKLFWDDNDCLIDNFTRF